MTARKTVKKSRRKAFPEGPSVRSLAALSRVYLEALLVRGLSQRTADTRRKDLTLFLEWCHERDLLFPQEIARPILESFQRHLFHYRKRNGAPLTLETQIRTLYSLRGLFGWLVKAGHMSANPASDLDLPKPPPRLPKATMTIEETERVLAVPDLRDPLGIRDRAILELLYATGIRRSELSQLGLWDLTLPGGTLRIRHGKGGRQRIVPVGERAAYYIGLYLDVARPMLSAGDDRGALFVTRTGGPFVPDALSELVRRCLKEAGLSSKGCCHLFRHTMATLMLDGGADVRYVQEMLGHQKLTSTQIYTHVAIGKLQRVHAATHPGARLSAEPKPGAAVPKDAAPTNAPRADGVSCGPHDKRAFDV
ncbi:MAG: site-specific tyrosine recombinase XerC [Acidobacteria bacterium]|nr:site-specific tyrosine recombinase XerC [Acidobacteriota bacterium]